jgi:hypothetical protein
LNRVIGGNTQPHHAYNVAVQLKDFYEKHKLTKIKRFMMKPNTLGQLHSFLDKYDMVSPMVKDNPDMLIAFRGRIRET